MKDFKRIKSYNKKYGEELDVALKAIQSYLIQAFTLFYGEEYHSQIENTIKNINYTYFLSERYFRLLEKKSFGLSNKDLKVARYYLEYLKGLQFNKREKGKYLVIKSSFDKKRFRSPYFLKYFISGEASYVTFNEEESTILLPLFVIDLKTIIHEINHVFMSEVVAVSCEESIISRLFLFDECEELFNDLIAEQILGIYRQIKGFVPYSLRRFQLLSLYQEFFYLIEPFYQTFLPLIKKSIMTKNYNLLLESVGKKEFSYYLLLVQKCFLQKNSSLREEKLLDEALLRMNNHVLLNPSIDYENYFKELESMGYRVRRLK